VEVRTSSTTEAVKMAFNRMVTGNVKNSCYSQDMFL